MKLFKFTILLLFIVGTIISCSDDQCNINTQSLLKLDFTVNDTILENDKYIDSLSIFSPEWTDSIHYWISNADSITLSPNSNITTLILTSLHEPLKDTIIVYHKSEMRLLSMECGFVLDFEIDSINNSWNLIDSISLVNDKITNEENGLIEIYYF